MMARIENSRTSQNRVIFIWLLSAFLFFLALRMLLHNSSITSPSLSDAPSFNFQKRARMYETMAKDLIELGPAFLEHGKTSQSLLISDLFVVKDGVIKPNLKPADPPVRANVLYLSDKYSVPISNAVKSIFSPYMDKAIWFQNSSFYHFSMFHASHHISPVPATEEEVEGEANTVKRAVESFCPLKIVLDRVVLTSTGVLLGCWQVSSGTDPADIRSKLRSVLPRAPEKQLYDDAILHTSFARLLGPPRTPDKEFGESTNNVQLFQQLVARLNNEIHGFQAVVSELWYVEEMDVLALALDGRMKVRRFQFGCSKARNTTIHM